MAITETARLIASLELQDKFSSTIKTVGTKLDEVGTKLDEIGTRAQTGVDKAKTKFGQLKDAASDTNVQTSAVNASLNLIEEFVPPSVKPLFDGLEDINNIAPKGILALLTTGVSSLGATVSSIGTSVATAAAGTGLSAIAASLAVAALPIFAAEAVLALTTPAAIAAQNLAARQATAAARGVPVSGVPTGDRSAPLSAVPSSVWKGISGGLSLEDRDLLQAQVDATNTVSDKLEDIRLQKPPVVSNPITVNVKTNVFGSTATTTVTYNRYVPSISGLLP